MFDPGILILHNRPRPAGAHLESDADVLDAVEAVRTAAGELGVAVRTAGVARLEEIPSALLAGDEQLVFNLVESLDGDPADFFSVPEVCLAHGRGCTGSDGPAQAVCFDKWRCRSLLLGNGVPVPEAAAVRTPDEQATLPAGPLIVKPARADASEGIGPDSVVPGPGPALQAALKRALERFGPPALIERFIEGREVNVSVVELDTDAAPCVLPPAEIEFRDFPPGKPRIVDYAAKWLAESFECRNTVRKIPADLPPATAATLARLARAAWDATGCRDYARVDFRLDEEGRPFVLEVNPNPGIAPDAGFPAALREAGIPFTEFVRRMLCNAKTRLRSRSAASRSSPSDEPVTATADTRIRRSDPTDMKPIVRLLADLDFFRPDEIGVAREVLADALAAGPDGHYQSFTAETGVDTVAGWVCFGPTPCTVDTFDIYWIAVAPHLRGIGIGRALLEFAEQRIAARGGRLAVAETSGRARYTPTRHFYLSRGYAETGRVADFYAPGDDKVVYVKTLGRGS